MTSYTSPFTAFDDRVPISTPPGATPLDTRPELFKEKQHELGSKTSDLGSSSLAVHVPWGHCILTQTTESAEWTEHHSEYLTHRKGPTHRKRKPCARNRDTGHSPGRRRFSLDALEDRS